MNQAKDTEENKAKWSRAASLSNEAVIVFQDVSESLAGNLPEISPIRSAVTALQASFEGMLEKLGVMSVQSPLQGADALSQQWTDVSEIAGRHSTHILELSGHLENGSEAAIQLQQYAQKIDLLYRELEGVSQGLFKPAEQA